MLYSDLVYNIVRQTGFVPRRDYWCSFEAKKHDDTFPAYVLTANRVHSDIRLHSGRKEHLKKGVTLQDKKEFFCSWFHFNSAI